VSLIIIVLKTGMGIFIYTSCSNGAESGVKISQFLATLYQK
jgi:hypothetical protein